MMIGGSTNSMLGYLAQSLKVNDASLASTVGRSTAGISSSRGVIRDEYVPSGPSSGVYSSNKIQIGKTEAGSEERTFAIAELEDILVDFLKENSTLPYNQMTLHIDGDGNFVIGEHGVFDITENSEGNTELTEKFLDTLNNVKVGDKSLGEAFIEAYAEEFGVDLTAAKLEGEEVKGLRFNFAHGVVGDKFVSEATSISFDIGDTSYGVDDTTLEKGFVTSSGSFGTFGKMECDSRARTQHRLDTLNEPASKDSVSFNPSSFLTDMFIAQEASSPLGDMAGDLNRTLLEGTITRILEAHNVDLKDGDTLAISLDSNGKFSINADESSIWGASGEELEGLCFNLEKALNSAKTEDGKSLGKSLLEQFSSDMGFDLSEVRGDETFSIAFSFRKNSGTGKNEIIDERRVTLDLLSTENDSDASAMLDTKKLEESINQILNDYGYDHETAPSFAFTYEDGVFSFDRENSKIMGLDDPELVNDLCDVVEAGLNAADFWNNTAAV